MGHWLSNVKSDVRVSVHVSALACVTESKPAHYLSLCVSVCGTRICVGVFF